MKKYVLVLLSLLLLSLAAYADEKSCPAKRAADKGFEAIEEFHKVLGPAWHKSWPNKDYDALLAAGPAFAQAYTGIAELNLSFKTEKRAKTFTESRAELDSVLAKYLRACADGNKEKVYELMPALHDAFEMTASAMLPIHYPQFDGFVITMNLIMETHLPANNTEGIIGSTETLTAKAEELTEDSIPEDLAEKKEEITAELTAIRDLVSKMKECCDRQDMENYKLHLEQLNTRVNEFHNRYI